MVSHCKHFNVYLHSLNEIYITGRREAGEYFEALNEEKRP